MKPLFQKFSLGSLYQWRFMMMFGALIAIVVLTALWFGPRGYTDGDYAAVKKSAELGAVMRSGDLTDVWFHALQKVGMKFGQVGLKIVSLSLAAATAGLIVTTIYAVVHRHAAMMVGLLAVASLPFVSLATTLQPEVMLAFWTITLLSAALHVLRRQNRKARIFWWLIFVGAATLAVFTPLMWVVLGLMLGISFVHPHARYSLRTLRWWQLFALVPLAAWIAALSFTIWQGGSVRELIGVPQDVTIVENVRQLVYATFGRGLTIIDGIIFPIVSFGAGALALLGVVKLASARHALRTYFMILGLVVGVVVTLIAPKFLIVEWVLLMLVASIGLQALIDEWYTMFPLNPYARVLGLVPLTLFIGVVVASDVMRVFTVQEYSAQVVRARDEGVPTMQDYYARDSQGGPVGIVVPEEKKALYRAVFDEEITVESKFAPDPTRLQVVDAEVGEYGVPKELLTNDRLRDGLEFRVY